MENPIEAQIHQMLEEHISAQNSQDLLGILRLMHKDSYFYNATQQGMMKVFGTFQIRSTLLEQKYIGSDGEYAYARTKIRNEKIAGPDFKNNITEALIVFKEADAKWRIWCQAPMNFHALDE